MNKIVLTGDRPTGQLHLGHYFGSLKQRVELQHHHEMFVLIADTQVLNNDVSKAKNIKHNILQLLRAYIAVGIDPKKVNFVLQSEIPQIFELTNYLGNLATLPMVLRNPTIKAENQAYNSSISMGFLNYPISQTSDIVLFDAELVPVGQDQTAILEFGNDLIEKFHYHFNCKIFKHITPLLSEIPKVIGVDGKQKMSKSLDNAIFLNDSADLLKKKINSMYTDSNHIKVSLPGQVQGNVVFSFLDIFLKDTEQLNELKAHYTRGGLGDVYLKQLLFKQIDEVISPIRDSFNDVSDNDLLQYLDAGTSIAQKKAKHKMSEIKDIIFR